MKKRKITAFLSAVVLGATCCLGVGLPVKADSNLWLFDEEDEEFVTEDGFHYKINENAVSVTGYTGTETELVIPSEIEGLPVIEFKKDNFDIFSEDTSVTSIVFPASIESIGNYKLASLESITVTGDNTVIESSAFSGCENLKSVILSGSEITVEEGAFSDCTNLSEIQFPASMKHVDGHAFDGTAWFNSQPDGLIRIGSALFVYKGEASQGSSIAIPSGITIICPRALNYGCEYVINISIPDSVNYIGESAFASCWNISNITLPSGLTEIASRAFRQCIYLKSIHIPETVQSIGEYAFEQCERLTSANIPDGVTNIDGVFLNCYSLVSVEIPDSVTSMNSTFCACWELKEATIPEGVTELNSTFQGCKALTSVKVPSGVKKLHWTFDRCENLKEVILSEGLEEIGYLTFNKCTSLENIVIPDTVTTIGKGVFEDCTSLTEISFPQSLTHVGNSEISDTPWFNNHEGLVCGGNCLLGYVGTMPEDTELVIPDNIQIIADNALAFQKSLIDITIPENVTYVGSEAFGGCANLKNVTVLNPDCSFGFLAFSDELNIGLVNDTGGYDGTITGYKNSSAEAYVSGKTFWGEGHRGTFVSLGEMPFTLGDVTIDDNIDARDAAAVLVAAAMTGAGNDSGLSYRQKKSADVNTDNAINAKDAAIILEYSAAVGAGIPDAKLENYIH